MKHWSAGETMALAQQGCLFCMGIGTLASHGAAERPCDCVYRAIFRACLDRFRRCANRANSVPCVRLEFDPDTNARRVWGMKNEEYVADFCLIARRTLGEGTPAHKLFLYHFLSGADWRLCAFKFGLNRGEIFHEVYRIQAKLGRAFRETKPYALFPLDEYFGGATKAGDRVSRATYRKASAALSRSRTSA